MDLQKLVLGLQYLTTECALAVFQEQFLWKGVLVVYFINQMSVG